MNHGMDLQEMLQEVVRHGNTKRDFVADTHEHMAMVPMRDFENEVAIVLTKEDTNTIERFEISENCHKQIASRLKVPQKYYFRLLEDHKDLVMENVNTLFNREPALRMLRTLDGRARAFLSNHFRRIDNEQILESILPVVKNEFPTQLLSSHVDEDRMYFKCLFTGPEHQVDLGPTADGSAQDIVRPGFTMGNSETGKGSFHIDGFFYRDYCLNGCVYGKTDAVSFKQIHVGSKIGIHEDLVLSNETMKLEDDLIISAGRDVLTQLAAPEFVQRMGERLRAVKGTASVKHPTVAVEAVCKELNLTESESTKVLENLLHDRDLTQWGMVNAVTRVANDVEDYNRASKLESLGADLLTMNFRRWNQITELVPVAA